MKSSQRNTIIRASLLGAIAGTVGITANPATALAATQSISPKAQAANIAELSQAEATSSELSSRDREVEGTQIETTVASAPSSDSTRSLEVIPETFATQAADTPIAADLLPSPEAELTTEIGTEVADIADNEPTAIADGASQLDGLQEAEMEAVEALTSEESAEDTTTVSDAEELAETEIQPLDQQALANQVRILNPVGNAVLDVPATTVILEYPTGADIELQVNGTRVDASLLGRTEVDETRNVTVETWYGVPLQAGTNSLDAAIRGTNTPLTTIEIQVRGVPTQLTVETREAQVAADGRSTATIQGQLLDENGNLSNWNTTVTLTATDGEFVGADLFPDQAGFQVEARNGRYTAELRSPLEAQRVQLRATANGLEAFNQIQFETQQRPSLVTGVIDLHFGARGTDYYSSFRDFLPPDGNNGYEFDVDAAVFAIGNLGDWLFTGAYNSDRSLNEDCTGSIELFRDTQRCEHNYPVYGDDSSRDVLAPSIDSLYLRFERTSPVAGAGIDYFSWGDFNTEEFATSSQLFSATTRQLHGFKFNYNIGDLAVTGFYGDNVDGFQRDTIAPDGTSGFYFLSRRLLVPGSENIFLELEELDRPGTVVERQALYRGTDYEIDYDRGTILFRDAVLRTAVDETGTVLVRRIVATYQFEGDGTNTNIYAGRLQYNLDRTLNHESWLGATYLRENQGNRSFELYGADAQISFGEDAQLIAEFAHSDSDFDLSGPISGSAYRLELEGTVTNWLAGRAYFRHTDAGFTNTATTSFVPGQTRYGIEAVAAVSETTNIRARYDHEENVGTAPRPLLTLSELLETGVSATPGSRVDNSLDTFSLGIVQQLGDTNLEFDWIHRERTDRISPNALSSSSDQLRSRLTTNLSEDITLFAQNELNLSSNGDSIYPNRTIFGLDWQLMPGITLGVNQIFLENNGINDRGAVTTIDLDAAYALGEDTTIRGRFSVIDGTQVGGTVGLEQGFTLAPGLRLDLAYEHVFNNISSITAAGTQFVQPFAVGSGASSLLLTDGDSFSVGLSYTDNPDLQASARLEHRSSSQGSNTVFTASALGRLSPAVSVLFNYELASAANQSLDGLGTSSTLKLGLAYRDPHSDQFNALLRYEYRGNPSATPETLLFGSDIGSEEHLFTAEAIYAPNWRWEFYGKYAFRTSTTRIGGIGSSETGGFDDFVSNSAVHLAQFRTTYRLGYDWDVVGEARWIGSSAGYTEMGAALELGYYPTPDLRLSAGYSFGSAYDRDFTGSNRSAGGFYFGITAKLNSLFGGFGLQEVAPPQQQESVLEAAATNN
ncbi:MAG: invasin domain 3-containing protein [Cyanobacteria bacterium J06639_14]